MGKYHGSERQHNGQCPYIASHGLRTSLLMVWTVSAVEWRERKCLAHECDSFRIMYLKTVNEGSFNIKGKKLTFNCESCKQVVKLSSPDYNVYFRFVENDGTIEISVPEGFTIGIPIRVIDYGLQ